MKITELEFVQEGCCGEHKRTSVDTPDGRTVHVIDHGQTGYRVVQMRAGVLCAAPAAGLTAEQVEALLT